VDDPALAVVDTGDETPALEPGDGDGPEVDEGETLPTEQVPGVAIVGESRRRPGLLAEVDLELVEVRVRLGRRFRAGHLPDPHLDVPGGRRRVHIVDVDAHAPASTPLSYPLRRP
jgi:hypothetical protein